MPEQYKVRCCHCGTVRIVEDLSGKFVKGYEGVWRCPLSTVLKPNYQPFVVLEKVEHKISAPEKIRQRIQETNKKLGFKVME